MKKGLHFQTIPSLSKSAHYFDTFLVNSNAHNGCAFLYVINHSACSRLLYLYKMIYIFQIKFLYLFIFITGINNSWVSTRTYTCIHRNAQLTQRQILTRCYSTLKVITPPPPQSKLTKM